MGLSNKKEEQLKTQPIIKTSMRRSKDGRYFVIKTTFTDIKPVEYVGTILEGNAHEEFEDDLIEVEA